jgi:hypothetical protein
VNDSPHREALFSGRFSKGHFATSSAFRVKKISSGIAVRNRFFYLREKDELLVFVNALWELPLLGVMCTEYLCDPTWLSCASRPSRLGLHQLGTAHNCGEFLCVQQCGRRRVSLVLERGWQRRRTVFAGHSHLLLYCGPAP